MLNENVFAQLSALRSSQIDIKIGENDSILDLI